MKKKNFFLSLMTIMMVATLSVCFVSCGGDDDDTINPDISQGEQKCTLETTTQNGVMGMRITGPNGN